MAKKISAMDAATVIASADLVPIVQGGINKKATVSLLPQKYVATMNVLGGVTSTLVTTITTEPISVYLLDGLDDVTATVKISWSMSGPNFCLDIMSVDDFTGLKVKIIY